MLHIILNNWQPFILLTCLILFWTWESIRPFFSRERRLRHAFRNLFISALNGIILAVVFAGAILIVAKTSEERGIGLLYQFELSPWSRILAAFLIMDIWTYWWHRINHTVGFFWRFHKMHHSDPEMDVTTSTRFHIGEIVMSSVFRIILIPVAGIPIDALILFDVIQMPIIYFHHANIFLPEKLDKLLRYIIVTPYMHKVHHSRVKRETDSNYTSVLSVWDRIFGSYTERDRYDDLRFGLDQYDDDKNQSVAGLMMTPLNNF